MTKDGKVWIAGTCKEISQGFNKDKYFRVALWRDGVRTRFFVHRLVAIAFKKNPKPGVYDQVNHLDWDRVNNNSSNLEWCTCAMNLAHARSKHKQKYVFDPAIAPF